jgi:alkylated DNA repair protein (DNA oxidative demethylase)
MADHFEAARRYIPLAPSAVLLGGFTRSIEESLLGEVWRIIDQAPFRHMLTPGGRRMSMAMTNCGAAGWVTDRTGYRYTARDPESDRPWPAMPDVFGDFAITACCRSALASIR